MANEAYNYIVKNQGEKTLLEYYQAVNLANIYYYAEDYDNALKKSNKALSIIQDSIYFKPNTLNTLNANIQKSMAILVKSKSEYKLQKQKDSIFLKSIFVELQKTINTLEDQKSIITEQQNVSILISNNTEIFDFTKQIALALYENTQNTEYLNQVLSLHESILYNRIRSRLNLKHIIAFANVPTEITKREQQLKNHLSSSLNTSNNNTIESFFKAENKWNTFLDSLKQAYPKYYKMRYATIEEPLDNLQNNIPNNTTVIRYLFIENDLYAFVVDKTQKDIFKLEFNSVKKIIHQLAENQSEIAEISPKLHKLYQQLWQPFEKEVKTENVIIIPDGELLVSKPLLLQK